MLCKNGRKIKDKEIKVYCLENTILSTKLNEHIFLIFRAIRLQFICELSYVEAKIKYRKQTQPNTDGVLQCAPKYINVHLSQVTQICTQEMNN